MARTGIARLRHFSHRNIRRMRRQEVIPRYLGEQATRLQSVGNGPDTYAVTAVSTGANTLQISGHGLVTGDGPYEVRSSGALPGGLGALEEYYIQVVDASNIRLVTDKRDAINANPVNLTSAGSGSITIMRHVMDSGAVLSWHDRRRAERVSSVADVDDL